MFYIVQHKSNLLETHTFNCLKKGQKFNKYYKPLTGPELDINTFL